MRLFKILVVGLFLITSEYSHAQYAYAQASAYAGYPPAGTYGGAQACPYVSAGGGNSEMASLENRINELDGIISDLTDEQDELIDGSHDILDDDRLPLKGGIREGLASIVEGTEVNCADIVGLSYEQLDGAVSDTGIRSLLKVLKSPETNLKNTDYCSDGGAGMLSAEMICQLDFVYSEGNKIDRSKSACQKFLNLYNKLEKNIEKAEAQKEKLENKYEKLEDKQFDRELKARIDGRSSGRTEACPSCGVVMPEPTSPSWGQIGVAAGLDVLNAFAYYKTGQYISKKNAALGWSTPPWWAGGIPAPNATMSLFASHGYGGGMGSGSWGCAPGAGYPFGPNGVYGSPYGNVSPYGACGGAFASPCGGGYGYPSFGGQYGLGGYGPYAGYPGFGAGVGIGVGGGLFPGMGGMYPGMGGMYPGMGGMFPGIGGGIGIGGGLGGMYPGMGGMFPGMGGMYPGMGGMYPGMGGMYGGLGGQYQMQLMQMQMQQQQAYMQAQARAMQNQQVVTQQMYSLQMEMAQMSQRYQYLQSQLMGGGFGAGLGVSFGVGLGVGGYGGLGGYSGYGGNYFGGTSGIPLLPGSTGSTPTR